MALRRIGGVVRLLSNVCAQQRRLLYQDVGVIGFPFSKGQPQPGVRSGPAAIRNAGLIEKIHNLERDVKDYGDLDFEYIADDPPYGLIKNPRNVGAANKKISAAVSNVINDNRLCISLGGDHAMSIGTLHGHATARPDMCVLWIDAHVDINTPLTSMTGNIHGTPVSFVVHELKDYVPVLPGFEWMNTCIHAKDIAFIGVRDIDPGERYIMEKFGLVCYSIHDIDHLGLVEVLKRAMDNVNPNRDRPIHISFDIDALDPLLAQSTGTPVYGGLTFREGMYIVEEVGSTGMVTGIDMVEVNPELGTKFEQNVTVNTAVDVLTAALGKRRHGNIPTGYVLPKAKN
ncbi:arginase-1-like [Saccoglossus kowalevskii]|uniref:Arginase n=1 Tax=Saccoglossus kowalevskii TaxID=10224 RepID=A0ABM0GX25_SACKO|nr:PREDICTED: arginase-1-like [Saccoglossus kowalevskii]